MKMPDKVYDVLKWICLIILPAAATLVLVLGDTWGYALAPQIASTITAIATFIGTCIGVSAVSRSKDQNDKTK